MDEYIVVCQRWVNGVPKKFCMIAEAESEYAAWFAANEFLLKTIQGGAVLHCVLKFVVDNAYTLWTSE